MTDESGRGLSGRRGHAKRNDEVILAAARDVFVHDPGAPIAAVAGRAGVGISALYRRYTGKDDLLRQLCLSGLRRFIREAEAAEAEPDGWAALTGFLERVVDADVHSLTARLAGTFTPTPELLEAVARADELAERLVRRAREGGGLRADVVADDLALILEGCAAIRAADAHRTIQLRRRHLALLIRGLSDREGAPLPGPAPRPGELSRWPAQP
ncbi:TetR/AcrR family transcriptional regulator [Catenuloplanes atrovinosus]|uniref:AcrR family transcriptional regulator n=1 Tax=Catenuloplanes atrovinosus TaxID=137266 RepID=A0AAE3YZG5_9ACTN|nr:TetR/AcrR family transcriptional regulator [Catenuloplanes atrovinosus]MDR7280989.1 AcrR family transcriptional regulator [Catenuloplanes atrovinosus]